MNAYIIRWNIHILHIIFFERQWLREMRWYTEYILIHSTQFEFWRKTKWKILKFLMHENSHANKNKKKMCHNIIMMVYDNWDNHRHHHHCLIACCMISDSSSYILIHNNVDGKKFLWNFFFESSSSLCLSWNIIHLVLYIPKKEGNSKVHTNTQTHKVNWK